MQRDCGCELGVTVPIISQPIHIPYQYTTHHTPYTTLQVLYSSMKLGNKGKPNPPTPPHTQTLGTLYREMPSNFFLLYIFKGERKGVWAVCLKRTGDVAVGCAIPISVF